MPSSHTLPDDPVYAFCPSYDLDNVPQQIRIVFDNMARLLSQLHFLRSHSYVARNIWGFMLRCQVCCDHLEFCVLTEA